MEKNTVILVHPRTFHEKNYANYWIPYSILSVGSELKKTGYNVCLIDNNLESLKSNQVKQLLKSYHPNDVLYVGISSMIGHQIKEGLEFASIVKEVLPEIPLVWGGPAPTILPEYFIRSPLVDVIVKGQGEKTSVELSGAFRTQKSLEDVQGILFKCNGKIKCVSDRKMPSRDKFSRYDYSIIPTIKYIRQDEHISTRVLNHLSSQGCPFGCGFCSEVALYNRKWVSRSKDRILKEISDLVENYNANGIKFYDANFFVNKNRVLSFSKEVLARKWNIKWAASAHPKNILSFNDKELEIVKESGCSRILIGAESGVDEELIYVNKDMTKKDVVIVAERLGKIGIHGSFTIIIGYPGFPSGNVNKTLSFGNSIAGISPLHEIKAHIYAPYPGTPLYKDAIRHGFIPPKTLEDWSNYDYYEAQTPWIKSDLSDTIRNFNRTHCPYVL